MCNVCLGLTALAEVAQNDKQELEMLDTLYPLVALNAILTPLQGFFNLLIYMRPNYLRWRRAEESRCCAAKRAIFGHPDAQLAYVSSSFHGDTTNLRCNAEAAGADGTITDPNTAAIGDIDITSSWTSFDCLDGGAHDEFGLINDDDHDNWGLFKSSLEKTSGSTLEPICELAESVFDPIVVDTSDEESILSSDDCCSDDSCIDMPRSPEYRWSPNFRSQEQQHRSTSPILVPPRRNNEEEEKITFDFASNENTPARTEDDSSSTFSAPRSSIDLPELQGERVILPIVSSPTVDTPIQVPVRRLSPPPPPPPSRMGYN